MILDLESWRIDDFVRLSIFTTERKDKSGVTLPKCGGILYRYGFKRPESDFFRMGQSLSYPGS